MDQAFRDLFKNPEDLKELKSCDIKVTINLDNVSHNFSSNLSKALDLQKGKKIEKVVKFFVPRYFRTPKDKEDNYDQIVVLVKELVEWTDDYFGHILVSGYVDKVVQHAMSYVFWICPFYSVESLKLKPLCCFFIMGAILDDWTDNSNAINYEMEGWEKNSENEKFKNRMEMIDFLTSFLETADVNEDLDYSKQVSIMDFLDKEPIVAAMYDAVGDVNDMIKIFQPHIVQKKCFGLIRASAIFATQGFQWSYDKAGKKTADDYSVETCRYFRQLEGTMEWYAAILLVFEDYELPPQFKAHPVFCKWNDLAAKMFGIQNDVLGFQKDVRNGEEDGILMQSIRKGCSVKVAVDEEMKLLSEFASDYVKLRRSLLNLFQDSKVHWYIHIMDSALYGYFQTFIESKKYGMKGQIEITHCEKPF